VGGQPAVLVETVSDDSYARSCLDFQTAVLSPAATATVASTPTLMAAGPASAVTPETTNSLPESQESFDQQLAPDLGDPGDSSSANKPVLGATATSEPPAVADAATSAAADLGVDETADNPVVHNAQNDGRAPSGLWFLALGVLLALVLGFFMLRNRTGKKT